MHCRVLEGVVILDLVGKLRIGEETRDVRTQIKALSEAGVKRIILNLDKVTEIDSSGLGELSSAYTTLARNGGQVKLLNLNPRVFQLMSMTKLLTVFEAYEDEDEAVESFHT